MKGITFIELLIAASLIIIISTLALSVFPRFKQSAELNSYAETGLSTLAEAKLNTLSSKGASNYGVHFETNKIVLFKGDLYNAGNPENKEVLLGKTVEIGCLSLNGGGADVIFNRSTGGTSQFGAVVFNSKINKLSSKTIVIQPAGGISILKNPEGLDGYWNFNETDGLTAYDSSINNNDGSLVNIDPLSGRVAGKICKGIIFNGIDSYVSIPTTNGLDHAGDITISLWVKPSVNSSSFHSGWNYFIYYANPFKYETGFLNTGGPMFKTYNDSGLFYELATSESFLADTWYHIVYRREGSLLETYVNGTLTASRNDFSGQLQGGSNELKIGGDGSLGGFIGTMDEVRVYGRALKPHEINQLFEIGI
ncbi:MAG: hypothetical protein COU46_02890 [Candidatus Niyogibacteria bacterium CG10_big_fil_rev_8_21_14_0_10_42_19]|uniref:LamG-like jellyroll fold domain-containing protein n=1 Tax=Candidatus Niyogibacteria bacterium CG10_big_fil_rev_8_21_14_0_10_42_19 TaxID=1974725 RepID=A0A2H0TF59_9BACT|nr:MAG: hypothetical protein COU46_02890 [Candidatus Niyogibacteria bacterium CG10_big_fil_rev_8_21_14_0_10_42_19]